MTYSLRARPRSADFDLVDAEGVPLGQVIDSPGGFTIYLLGDVEPLLSRYGSADEALDAFEDWAASNTTNNILLPPAES